MEDVLYMLGSGAALALLATHVVLLFSRRRHKVYDAPEYRRLADEFERYKREVWSEVVALREEHGTALEELHERLDFTERLLARGAPTSDEADERHPTPA